MFSIGLKDKRLSRHSTREFLQSRSMATDQRVTLPTIMLSVVFDHDGDCFTGLKAVFSQLRNAKQNTCKLSCVSVVRLCSPTGSHLLFSLKADGLDRSTDLLSRVADIVSTRPRNSMWER